MLSASCSMHCASNVSYVRLAVLKEQSHHMMLLLPTEYNRHLKLRVWRARTASTRASPHRGYDKDQIGLEAMSLLHHPDSRSSNVQRQNSSHFKASVGLISVHYSTCYSLTMAGPGGFQRLSSFSRCKLYDLSGFTVGFTKVRGGERRPALLFAIKPQACRGRTKPVDLRTKQKLHGQNCELCYWWSTPASPSSSSKMHEKWSHQAVRQSQGHELRPKKPQPSIDNRMFRCSSAVFPRMASINR